ncbi:MAG: hypothetical protein AAFP84_19865, partial [Actinomycetota bacterium]
ERPGTIADTRRAITVEARLADRRRPTDTVTVPGVESTHGQHGWNIATSSVGRASSVGWSANAGVGAGVGGVDATVGRSTATSDSSPALHLDNAGHVVTSTADRQLVSFDVEWTVTVNTASVNSLWSGRPTEHSATMTVTDGAQALRPVVDTSVAEADRLPSRRRSELPVAARTESLAPADVRQSSDNTVTAAVEQRLRDLAPQLLTRRWAQLGAASGLARIVHGADRSTRGLHGSLPQLLSPEGLASLGPDLFAGGVSLAVRDRVGLASMNTATLHVRARRQADAHFDHVGSTADSSIAHQGLQLTRQGRSIGRSTNWVGDVRAGIDVPLGDHSASQGTSARAERGRATSDASGTTTGSFNEFTFDKAGGTHQFAGPATLEIRLSTSGRPFSVLDPLGLTASGQARHRLEQHVASGEPLVELPMRETVVVPDAVLTTPRLATIQEEPGAAPTAAPSGHPAGQPAVRRVDPSEPGPTPLPATIDVGARVMDVDPEASQRLTDAVMAELTRRHVAERRGDPSTSHLERLGLDEGTVRDGLHRAMRPSEFGAAFATSVSNAAYSRRLGATRGLFRSALGDIEVTRTSLVDPQPVGWVRGSSTAQSLAGADTRASVGRSTATGAPTSAGGAGGNLDSQERGANGGLTGTGTTTTRSHASSSGVARTRIDQTIDEAPRLEVRAGLRTTITVSGGLPDPAGRPPVDATPWTGSFAVENAATALITADQARAFGIVHPLGEATRAGWFLPSEATQRPDGRSDDGGRDAAPAVDGARRLAPIEGWTIIRATHDGTGVLVHGTPIGAASLAAELEAANDTRNVVLALDGADADVLADFAAELSQSFRDGSRPRSVVVNAGDPQIGPDGQLSTLEPTTVADGTIRMQPNGSWRLVAPASAARTVAGEPPTSVVLADGTNSLNRALGADGRGTPSGTVSSSR